LVICPNNQSKYCPKFIQIVFIAPPVPASRCRGKQNISVPGRRTYERTDGASVRLTLIPLARVYIRRVNGLFTDTYDSQPAYHILGHQITF